MADRTSIEWTDATWNVINGCSVISPGCKRCYAMKLAGTRLRHHHSREGLTIATDAGPVWTGEVRFFDKVLLDPIRWRRPRRTFVCAHGDLFHENVPDAWIDRVFAVMALAPQHMFQVLTKRADRMRAYFEKRQQWERLGTAVLRIRELHRTLGGGDLPCIEGGSDGPLPNVWLGVSAENQHWLMQRAPHLVETPAAKRFLSLEPALQEMDIEPFVLPVGQWSNSWANNYPYRYPKNRVDWVIVGGESGDGARPMHPDWVRGLRDQCAEGDVPFFFKQWGEWTPGENCGGPMTRTERTADWFDGRWHYAAMTPGDADGLHIDDEPDLYRVGKRRAGRMLDGVTHDGMPA